jgi:serine/threonine-protein kinase
VGIIVGGLGVLGIGVGSVFGIRAIVKQDESNAEDHCHDGNLCDETGLALREEGHSAGTVSTVMFIVGGVALAGGVTLFVTAPSPASTTSAKVAVGPGGISLRGTW